MRPVWFVVQPNREQLVQIGALIDEGKVRPIIDTVLPLSQARQAYEQGAKGHTRGKIVLRVVDQENLGTQPLLVYASSTDPPSDDTGMDMPGMSMAARAAAGITIKGRIMS